MEKLVQNVQISNQNITFGSEFSGLGVKINHYRSHGIYAGKKLFSICHDEINQTKKK
jgi:hypothetical protein